MADAAEAARRPEAPPPAPGRDTSHRAERADAAPPSALPRLAAAQAVPPALPTRPAPRPALPTRAASRREQPAAHRPAPAAPPRELPPIEVTIGRIEVRAATAAPVAARSRGTAPRLGLDQYLRERGGHR